MPRILLIFLVWVSIRPFSNAQAAKAQPDSPTIAQKALGLAKSGHCPEALPLLRKSVPRLVDKDLKREAGFSGVRCAMFVNDSDAAVDFMRILNREFPGDPEVLYTAVHTYSDLSSQAAQRLATTAPDALQTHQLNAESLEMQGKWDEAEGEYRAALQKDPRAPGIHFRLGRLLLSKPNPAASMAEDAKNEFQQELKIDPTNAGAEYVLGELARQGEQWDDAVGHFSRATKLDPLFGDAFLGLGSTLLALKRFPESILPLEMAVKLEAPNPAAHYNLATAYSRTGRKVDADREFAIHKKMMEKQPSSPGQARPPNNFQ
jgi:tetratricopeptide (TPR) repeat protein